MDIWDWLRGLKRWWWLLIVMPVLAMGITWFASPKPQYESNWTLNIIFDDPSAANNPNYVDFVVLDDLDLLLGTGVLGDVIYLKLPQDVQAQLSREEFGDMIHSRRHAHFVWVSVRGDDPEIVRSVTKTIDQELTDAVNFYLVPPAHRKGPATIQVLDPISEPALNTKPRVRATAAAGGAGVLVALAATGVAEWLRLSYRAKYGAR